MSALAPGAGPVPVQGTARGAGDPAATAILMQMTELAHRFLSAEADPEDKQAMAEVIQLLAHLSQQEATESAPGPSRTPGGPQGLGAPFAAALQQRGMMGGGQAS